MFDTHAIARRLIDAGLSDKQADALTDALREAAEHDAAGIDVETLATKADLRAEVSSLEARLYRAMLMQTAVGSSRTRLIEIEESGDGPPRRNQCRSAPATVRLLNLSTE